MNAIQSNPIRELAGRWWLVLLGGILLLSAGVWTIASPAGAYLSLSLVFAACIQPREFSSWYMPFGAAAQDGQLSAGLSTCLSVAI